MNSHDIAELQRTAWEMTKGINRIAEALECRDTATDTPASTKPEATESSMTPTETSWPHSSTKPAKHIATIADYVSSRNPPPRTKTVTSVAKTALPSWAEHYWVEQLDGMMGGAWLTSAGPEHMAPLNDNWTLGELFEAAESAEEIRARRLNG